MKSLILATILTLTTATAALAWHFGPYDIHRDPTYHRGYHHRGNPCWVWNGTAWQWSCPAEWYYRH